MATNALDAYRGFNYEVAETLAPSWESRRADIERLSPQFGHGCSRSLLLLRAIPCSSSPPAPATRVSRRQVW